MLVLEEEADNRRDILRHRRINDKHYVYDKVFGEDSTQVSENCSKNNLRLDNLHGFIHT